MTHDDSQIDDIAPEVDLDLDTDDTTIPPLEGEDDIE